MRTRILVPPPKDMSPRQPLIILFESLTSPVMSTSLLGRNSTIACDDLPSAARKTRALLGRPCTSSWWPVMRYSARGFSPRKRCILFTSHYNGCQDQRSEPAHVSKESLLGYLFRLQKFVI